MEGSSSSLSEDDCKVNRTCESSCLSRALQTCTSSSKSDEMIQNYHAKVKNQNGCDLRNGKDKIGNCQDLGKDN